MSGEHTKKGKSTFALNINDPQSPYYLCSADHPGNIVSSTVLNGENYANWSRIVTKNKFCFVDGSLTKLENNNPDGHVWEKCNSIVIA